MVGRIAQGSMGIIYRSRDPHTGRPVALKTIQRTRTAGSDPEIFSASLRFEAQAAARLVHCNIVAVYEYGHDENHDFIAMEYVEGRSLRQSIDAGTTFSLSNTVTLLSQLLDALQYAHDRGVWHRDIKPANILLMSNGQVKVTDFGIAQSEPPVPAGPGDEILGSPGFIAPETYLGGPVDGRIDIFAAGAILYELLSGTPPFTGRADEIMFKVCSETPLRPSAVTRQPMLQPFDGVVLTALARRPEDRFASATEFRTAIRRAQAAVTARRP